MDILKLSIDTDPASGKKVVNHRFRLVQTIGQGQFGKVLLAEDVTAKKKDRYVAVKTINRVDKTKLITKTYLSHTTKIKREIQIMKECNHPNVVKLYQVIDDLRFDKIFLVLEYCQYGEIDWKRYNHYHEKYFKEDRGITLNKILRDVVNGLEYLHTYKHIIHRDLKPSNLLISSDRTIKISDFGVSLILENNANDDKELGKTMGTPAFFAPELCQFVNNRLLMFNEVDLQKSKIDARIDIWSLGVVLYCLIFHQLPFEGHNEFSLFKNIVTGELKFPKIKEGSHVKSQDLNELTMLKSLISRMLSKDSANRPTIKEIKNDPFTCFDLLKKQKEEFENFNKNIISQQSPLLAETWASEKKLSSKIKRVFGKKSDTTAVPPSQLPLTVKLKESPEKPVNVSELEKVDDLLDSYLDDLSSMGSFDEDTEPEVVDTTNLLSSLQFSVPASPHDALFQVSPTSHYDSHQGVTPSVFNESSPFSNESHYDQLISRSNPELRSLTTLKNSHSSLLVSLRISRGSIPPPLTLTTSSFSSPTKIGSNLAAPNSPFSEQKTPVSAVTIGAGSPLSIKSMFSPSRRFFSRIKKDPEPTIHALSSPVTQVHSTSSSYTDLAPPPAFGSTRDKKRKDKTKHRVDRHNSDIRENRNSGELMYSDAGRGSFEVDRKNSILLVRSARSNGLSKISSSSSSLNLHAYLTDSASSSPRWASGLASGLPGVFASEKFESDTDNEEANRTVTMDQYLNRL